MKALAKPSENDAGRAMGAVVPMRALIAPAAPAKPAGRKRRRSRIAVALDAEAMAERRALRALIRDELR